MTVDESGRITWTPDNDDVLSGPATVSISVADGGEDGASPANQTFQITVINTNDAPVFASTPTDTILEDSEYSYTMIVSDEDPSDALTITVVTLPSWLSLNGETLSGTPLNEHVGTHSIELRATTVDTITQLFDITAENTNDQPSITSIEITSATEDALYSYQLTVSDDVSDEITKNY